MVEISRTYKVLLILLAIVLLAIGFRINYWPKDNNPANLLRNLGLEVEVKNVTFQGYESQNISAKSDKTNIFLKIIPNVEKNSAAELLKNLESPIENTGQDQSLFDPYTGQTRTLSIPTELRPIKRAANIRGQATSFYLISANEIFSMEIYSAEEFKYRGLFSVYFCENEKKAYKLEVYYPKEKFDEKAALSIMSKLYCK